MNNSNFLCKDCAWDFPTAKAFVNHIETCADNYNPDASLQLQNAALFLREWVKEGLTTLHIGNMNAITLGFKKPKKLTPLEKLLRDTYQWLKVNKLQGDLK